MTLDCELVEGKSSIVLLESEEQLFFNSSIQNKTWQLL